MSEDKKEDKDSLVRKSIRYFLIFVIYDLICSIVWWFTNEAAREWKWKTWNISTWWVVGSFYLAFGVGLLFLSPYLNLWLKEFLDYQMERLTMNKKDRLKTKQEAKEAKRTQKNQARQAFQNQTRSYPPQPTPSYNDIGQD